MYQNRLIVKGPANKLVEFECIVGNRLRFFDRRSKTFQIQDESDELFIDMEEKYKPDTNGSCQADPFEDMVSEIKNAQSNTESVGRLSDMLISFSFAHLFVIFLQPINCTICRNDDSYVFNFGSLCEKPLQMEITKTVSMMFPQLSFEWIVSDSKGELFVATSSRKDVN